MLYNNFFLVPTFITVHIIPYYIALKFQTLHYKLQNVSFYYFNATKLINNLL